MHRVHVLRLHQPHRVIARLRLSPRADDDDDIKVEIAALHGVLYQHGRGGGEEDQRQDQHELRHSPPAPRTTNTITSDPPSDTFSSHMRFRFSRS